MENENLSPSSQRAWIEIYSGTYSAASGKSPSSQRAWIEIFPTIFAGFAGLVALLAEGVDRNVSIVGALSIATMSPSSQRAWIEIAGFACLLGLLQGRPPRRGRG